MESDEWLVSTAAVMVAPLRPGLATAEWLRATRTELAFPLDVVVPA